MLQKCTDLIDTFDDKKTTVDAYATDAECLKDKRLGDVELKFVKQVFYGCVRYQRFLRLFVTSFLYRCPTQALRSEQTLYTVLGYLLFFRLEELGVGELRQLLNCGLGTSSALMALMQYALDAEALERWVKVEWCKIYDVRYVEEEIIGKLQRHLPDLEPIVQDMEYKATGTVQTGAAASTAGPSALRKRIVQKPFNLTKPKPRLIPEPEEVSREFKALPVPAKLHAAPLSDVETQKKARRDEERERVSAKYKAEDQFDLKTLKRSDENELKELEQEVERKRMQECTFKPKTAAYLPPKAEAIVRQNVASVLREDALLRQKQASEYDLLKQYEVDLHDASEFHRWQEEAREKDHLDEEQRMHRRIVEMQLARESAIEAQESQVRRKGILAEHQRIELKVELDQRKVDAEVELFGKQQLVVETQGDRGKAREAEANELRLRAERAESIRVEKEAEAERKRREDEQEMERRMELIRQIRALEKVPVERFKQFDPAESPCRGFLEEMSHAELGERLKSLEAQHAMELERKRERQLDKKREKQEEIAEKAESLARIRERATEETKARYSAIKNKKEQEAEVQQRYRDMCVVEVAAKIQQKKVSKRNEEAKLRRELREITVKRQFLAANAQLVEMKAHGEQHAGLDREAKDRQKNILTHHRKLNEIRSKECMIRATNRQKTKEDLQGSLAAADDRLRRAKAADVALKEDILRANQTARQSQRSLEAVAREEFGHSSSKYSGGPLRINSA